MTIIPPEKLGVYLSEAEKYGVLPMFFLELSSGLRRGELLALQWEDLDVKDRILSVSKQVVRMDGNLVVTEPKTRNSIRKVALSQQAVELLIQEHKQHLDNPILFPSPRTGSYWSPDAVSRINRKLLKNAGAEAGRTAESALPRSQTHIRYYGNLQRRRCENPVQYAGPLQRRIHTGYLHAHNQRYAARRSGEDRRLHGVGNDSQHPGTD